jgi:anti-sigma B factor antagonist
VSPAPFKVRSDREAGVFVISVEGELDMNTARQLEPALERALEPDDGSLLIDLSRCEFIDSTGIALLVRAWQRLGPDGSFALCGAGAQVERVLGVTGLDETIPSHPSRQDALAQLGG